MNIAHLLPYSARFPLRRHNGRYEWVLRLATLQAAQGHAVTVYAAPGSRADSSGVQWRSLPESLGNRAANNRALFALAIAASDHDMYHSHFDSLHYEIPSAKPVIFTQHWFPTAQLARSAAQAANPQALAVPVTQYMRQQDNTLGIACTDTIYHGVDLTLFAFSAEPRSDRLLYAGRIAPHKAVREAVRAACGAGEKLDIIGKIHTADEPYWQSITPYVDGDRIRYLGPKTQPEVAAALAHAKALLFLQPGTEAFGQTIIEAQACGTPVILSDAGAARELIQGGVTGFVTGDDSSRTAAMRNVSLLDPRACRRFAERFSQERMVQAYQQLYEQLTR